MAPFARLSLIRQVTRRGVERVASAAILEPHKALDGDDVAQGEGAPRYTITVFEFLDNDQVG